MFAFHPVMLAALPLKETSNCIKSDTDSVNVIVAANAPVCAPDGTPMVTLGLSTSTVTVLEVAAVLGLPAASVATPALTFKVTVPLVVGATVAVKVVLSGVSHPVMEAVAVPESESSD